MHVDDEDPTPAELLGALHDVLTDGRARLAACIALLEEDPQVPAQRRGEQATADGDATAPGRGARAATSR